MPTKSKMSDGDDINIQFKGDLRDEQKPIEDLYITNAKENATRNGIEGVQFYAADVGKFLVEHPEYAGKIRTIILDPARAGVAPKTMKKIINLGAERMVYVSCNPATQARDMELMSEHYEVIKTQLVDMFPHTPHIESVVTLTK